MPKAVQSKLPQSFTSPHSIAKMPQSADILVAFSGGADSSALLSMLIEYSKGLPCTVYAAHVNHGIRGEEADRDEAFCKSVADAYGIKLFTLRADVPAIAMESGESIETAARRVRYSFFASVMKKNNIPILVTAHNANDNLETIIFNLTRGTGLDGMRGIPARRDFEGRIIARPILQMSRDEILDYCKNKALRFVTDSTNADTDYTRNKIRASVIPVLADINENAVKNASRASLTLTADAEYLWSVTEDYLSRHKDGDSLPLDSLSALPAPIFTRAVMSVYSEASNGGTLDFTHISDIYDLVKTARPHSRITLGNKTDARIEDGRLFFTVREEKKVAVPYEIPLKDGANTISQINAEIIIGNSQNKINIYKKSILLYLDSAKINGELTARDRRAGDRILEKGMHKSIKKLMCDRKIPIHLRSRLPVICDESGIVAVPFLCIRDGVFTRDKSPENTLLLQFNLF